MAEPKRGEIWLVDLNPTRGQEIRKTRPAIVISADVLSPVPLRIVIPITSWQAKFEDRLLMVKVVANRENGLANDSAANVLQVRSIAIERFVRCLGQLSPDILEEVLAGLMICVDYETW
jgi:mRNA interferase MazF